MTGTPPETEWPSRYLTRTRTVLVAIVGLFAVTAAIFCAIISLDKYAEQTEHAWRTARDTAHLLEEHVRRTVGATDLILGRVEDQVIAGDIAAVAGNADRFAVLARFADILPEVGSIGIVDKDGRVLMNSASPTVRQTDVSDREYFRAHRFDGAKLWIGPALVGRASGQYGFTISRRVQAADGSFAGVMVVSIDAAYFAEYLKPLNLGPLAVTSIVRRDRTILLRHPFDPNIIGRDFLEPGIFDGGNAVGGSLVSISQRDGVERFMAYRAVPGLPIIVATGIAKADALRGWHELMAISAGLALAVAAVLTLLTWLAIRSVAREERAQAALREDRSKLEERIREATAEIRAALMNKEVLLKEVNHRVRNSLNLTASLLSLQGRNIGDPASRRLFEEACQRVITVSRVHESLYRSDRGQSVEFASYLRDLCGQLSDTFSGVGKQVELRVECDELDLPADAAIPLALVVNELVTNAYKYAYPDGRPGQVAVQCRVVEMLVILSVRDQGVGLPADFRPAECSSLGMTLIVALVRQLGGTLSVEREQPGANFVVVVPLKAEDTDGHIVPSGGDAPGEQA